MEIRSRRPLAKIVLNSILPRGDPGQDVYSGSPPWSTLSTVNQWLECYADENVNVEFFNATDLFLNSNETTTKADLYQDPVHPSVKGYTVFADAIARRVLQLIA